MKASRIILSAAALLCLASAANAQIKNSKHDFSTYAWSGGEICKPCHTPHFANHEAGALWNHALTTATYTMFEGGTGTAAADFDYTSRLCLSCHDGTVALDSFGGTTGSNFIPGGAKIGTDLRDDHPVGSEAVYPTTTVTYMNPQNTSHQIVSTAGTLRLYQWFDASSVEKYVVGCRTCHNPHNKGNYGNGAMLNFANTASQLCLTCHVK